MLTYDERDARFTERWAPYVTSVARLAEAASQSSRQQETLAVP